MENFLNGSPSTSTIMSELCAIHLPGDLDFSSTEEINTTMQEIELAHWDYLDRMTKRYRLPRLGFTAFMEKLLDYHNRGEEIPNIRTYLKQYSKFKKSRPTAGAIILHENEILLVRVVGTRVYSLPKGKAEPDETVEQTAIREVQEETGLDLSNVICPESLSFVIGKTRLFVIEADERISHFDGYNRNEIVDIKWFGLSYVSHNEHRFSKQVLCAVSKLRELRPI